MLIYLLFRCCLLYIAKKNDKYKWFKKSCFQLKKKERKGTYLGPLSSFQDMSKLAGK